MGPKAKKSPKANDPAAALLRATDQKVEELFFRGDFPGIIASYVDDGPTLPQGDPALRYVIAALCFTGRVDDAITIFSRRVLGTHEVTAIACRFFIAIGLVRLSRYDEGRKMLASNVSRMRHLAKFSRGSSRDEALASDMDTGWFYTWQGLAFFRYFQCRFGLALQHAQRAWGSALLTGSAYGKVLAADLAGYCLAMTGQISPGLDKLSQALHLSTKNNFGAHTSTLQGSISLFRSVHFLKDGDDFVRDEHKLRSAQENFSDAAVRLELAKHKILRGRLGSAERDLERASAFLLKAGHRRHRMLLFLRLGHVRFLQGRPEEAAAFLLQGEEVLHQPFDIIQRLQIYGLWFKLWRHFPDVLSRSDRYPRQDFCRSEIIKLTARTQSGVGRNILKRQLGLGTPIPHGDDQIGDLISAVSREHPSYPQVIQVIDAGLAGALFEVIPQAIGKQVICFGLATNRTVVFDRGEVRISTETVSATTRWLAVALGIPGQARTKEDLVQSYWGYHYNPLRHDPMLYAAINRLRRSMGERGEWLISTKDGYQLADDVHVIVYEPFSEASTRIPVSEFSGLGDKDAESPAGEATRRLKQPSEGGFSEGLNYRQLSLMAELGPQSFTGVNDLCSQFDISRMSALRDLREMERLGIVRRVGKGRATKYQRI